MTSPTVKTTDQMRVSLMRIEKGALPVGGLVESLEAGAEIGSLWVQLKTADLMVLRGH